MRRRVRGQTLVGKDTSCFNLLYMVLFAVFLNALVDWSTLRLLLFLILIIQDFLSIHKRFFVFYLVAFTVACKNLHFIAFS